VNDVKYKLMNKSSSQYNTLKKSEIHMIKYANGDKDIFTKNADTQVNKKTAPIAVSGQGEELFVTKSGLSGIKVKNSYGQTLLRHEVISQMTAVPEALRLYKKGITNLSLGKAFGIVGTVSIGAGCVAWAVTNNFGWWIIGMSVGVPFIIPELILISNGNRKIESAVGIYNGHIQHYSDLSLKFGVTQSGGLGFTFNF